MRKDKIGFDVLTLPENPQTLSIWCPMSIEKLREQLRDYDRRYRAGEPAISDLEYDRLLRQLHDRELESGKPVPSDSPTRRIGGEPIEGLVSVAHRVPMLSIENTYSIGELRDFGRKIDKLLDKEPVQWVVELKIDGVAASLIYKDGLLVQGLTRGDGIRGDDITHNIRTVRDIPLRLAGDPPDLLEVRGEIYMKNSDLVLLNQRQQERGHATYANTRNVTAGSIRLLDPAICAERPLRFFAHSVGSVEGCRSTNHFDFLEELESYGIPVTPHVKRFDSFEAAADYCEEIYSTDENFLSELDFEIDGLVLKVDRFDQREKLGSTSKSPRWIIAYKVEKYEAVTRLREIRVQVGKTGAITPVAELKPVELAGTTVSRASLHNAEEIERKDIRVGDTVVVEKAGKIIPHVVRVEKHLRPKGTEPFVYPVRCPVCGGPTAKDEGGVYIRCNNPECPAQFKEKLRYFAGRNAMDIEGLGDKLINQLVDEGLVRNFGDLYRLDLESIESKNLQRMGKRLAQKLLDGIERSKSRDWARLLNALSIRHVGTRTATILARHFGHIDRLVQADVQQLSEVEEIGPIIAQSVYDFFHGEQGIRMVKDLKSLGLFGEAPAIQVKKAPRSLLDGQDEEEDGPEASGPKPLDGMTIVVTGSLEHFKRNEIEETIERYGGRASSSVSSKTSFVLVGNDPGSKLAKAEKLGVRVVREPEFMEMLEPKTP